MRYPEPYLQELTNKVLQAQNPSKTYILDLFNYAYDRGLDTGADGGYNRGWSDGYDDGYADGRL